MDKFSEYLVKNKFISQEDMEKVWEERKKKSRSLIEIIAEKKLITEDDLIIAISKYLSLPPIKIAHYNISPDIVELIPYNLAQEYHILPVGKIGNTLTVAMADPSDVLLIDNLSKITGCEINPVVASLSEIKEYLNRYYTHISSNPLEELLSESETVEVIKDKDDSDVEHFHEDALVKDAPVVKFTDYILKRAIEETASDILIEPLDKTSRVRFRVDGILREIEVFSKKMHPFLVSRIKVMANLNIAEHRLPQEGRFRQKIDTRDVDFRISILPSSFGEKIAIRVLDKTTALLSIDALGFKESVLAKIKEDALKPHGMILVCGPTGSGKTTTLYSLINYIYTPQKNIITVEDPIEYQLKGINQVGVNIDVGLTFASALRSILRQDPDIIMIGEIRDAETAEIAIKAALTGHLLLSTLHTTTSAGAVTRLVNMGIEPFLLSSTLIGVIAQRLVRKLCVSCREKTKLPSVVREKYFHNDSDFEVYKAKGCKLCSHTGYRGRIILSEYLRISPNIKDLIETRASEHIIKKEARKEKMFTLREDGMAKVRAGITTIEEVLRVTGDDEPL